MWILNHNKRYIKMVGNQTESMVDDGWTPKSSRLSDMTLELAGRALSGEWGREMRGASFRMEIGDRPERESGRLYAQVIRRLAEEAPLRVLEGERIIGSATFAEATWHATPGCDIPSTSHTTIGFGPVLVMGHRGLRENIRSRSRDPGLDEDGTSLLDSMLLCLDAFAIWHRRHIDLLEARVAESEGQVREEYLALFDHARDVPENPPRGFREALQSLWFMYSFQRLCGNWSGLGRIDAMLGPYLKRDLEQEIITLDEARELLAHFWIKGCEWIGANPQRGGGDAQFYQNIVLAGIDEDGNEVANEVTYLVLDVVEDLRISDFPVAVRINARTPVALIRRVAQIQRLGGGIVAVYNEDVVIKSMTRFGYPLKDARNFSNDGCWEVIPQGKTAFTYIPFDMLKLLQEALGLEEDGVETDFPSFEALYEAFLERLRRHVDEFHAEADARFINGHRESGRIIPTPLLSMYVEGCVEKARSYNDRGAKHSVAAIHAGGVPDVANSLHVIRKLLFEERQLTWPEFADILRRDWSGHETLRKRVAATYQLYGNDEDESDAMLKRVYDDYVTIAGEVGTRNGVLRPVGISTFGREIAYRGHRLATSFGRHQHDILATNLAPTPGTDVNGPTAVVKSFCKVDLTKLGNGAPLELKLAPDAVQGEAGLAGLTNLLKTFVNLGGFYLQVDVVDSETLKDAKAHPERHPNLSVRISGWSARFATLSEEWQDMIIQRTEQQWTGPNAEL